MSSEGEKKAKLGFSKYRLLLWLIILMGVWALFNAGLNPFMTRHNIQGSYFYPKTGIYKNEYNESCDENDFIFIYSKKDREDIAAEETEKMKSLELANPTDGSYMNYTVYEEVKGVGHRDKKKASQELAISIYLPIVIIILTILFERPIVRKLEKMNE